LAEVVGVSHTLIAKFETGKLTPNTTQLIAAAAAAKASGVKVEYFWRPATLSQGPVGYQTKRQQHAKERHHVESNVLDLAERRFELEQFYPTPPTASFVIPSSIPAKCL